MSVTAVIGANAVSPIGDHKGPCQLVLSQKSITVSVAAENGSRDLGTWPFDCIRRFHSQDQCYFSFTSGRRGPFGVQDYVFQVKEEDLAGLQSKLTHFTGAKFDAPKLVRSSTSGRNANYTGSVPPPLPQSPPGIRQACPHAYSHAHLGSVMPSSPTIMTASPTNILDHAQPTHSYITTNVPMSDEPVVVPKVPVARKHTSMKVNGVAAESKASASKTSSKLRSAFSLKSTSTSQLQGGSQSALPPVSIRNGRSGTAIKPSSTSGPLQTSSSAFKRYTQTTLVQSTPSKQANLAVHKDKQSSRRTPSPPSSLSPAASKQVSQGASPPLPRRSEVVLGKARAMMTQVVPQEHDLLANIHEESGTVRAKLPGSYSLGHSEGPKSSDEESDSVFPLTSGNQPHSNLDRSRITEVDGVELRIKKSPSPSGESETSNLDRAPRVPPTKKELRQLKKLSREPLVNISGFTQQKRNAEYVDIDLPSDRNSDAFSEASDSLSSSLYSVPSSLPAVPSSEQVYDIPTAANPGNVSRPTAFSDPPEHYDVPPSSLIGGGSRLSAHVPLVSESHYDTPRSSVLSRSKSPPQRALPHLPDDYVNVVPRQFKHQVSGKSRSESSVDEGDGLYSEIPATGPVWGVKISRVSSAGKINSIKTFQGVDIYSDMVDTPNPQSSSKRFSGIESQLPVEIQGETIAKKLADAGYEFVHPASSPALVSPPAEHSGMRSPFSSTSARNSSLSPSLENAVSDEYIVLQREAVAVDEQDYMNVASFQVGKRERDDYEVIRNGGLKPKFFSGVNTQQLTVESNQKADLLGGNAESTRRVESAPSKSISRPNYVNVGVGYRSRKQSGSYEEVKERIPELASGPALVRTFSPSQDQPTATPSKQSSATTLPHRAQSASPTALVGRTRNLSDVHDILEYELVDEDSGCVSPSRHISLDDKDDEYVLMKSHNSDYIVMQSPVARTSSSSSTSSSGSLSEYPELPPRPNSAKSNPVAIPEKMLVPTAIGSPIVDEQHPPRLRKQSLTVGDPLDSIQGLKKHTYINIPEPSAVTGTSPPSTATDSCLEEDKGIADKKPMPLPRQSSLKQSSPPLVERRNELTALHQTSKTLPSIPLDQSQDKNGRASPPNKHSEIQSSSSKVKLMIRQFSSSCSPSDSPCTSPKSKRKH